MGWSKREITTYVVRLEELAETIRQNHAEAFKNLKLAVVHAIAAGEALIEAKKRLKHGQWLPWLQVTANSPSELRKGICGSPNCPSKSEHRCGFAPAGCAGGDF
jgi:hypothetical protein